MSQLQSTELLAALAVATKPVKVVSLTGEVRFETPARALNLACSRHYVGRMRNGRLANMHEVREKPAHRADGYRTTGGAPVLPVTQEWIWRVCGRPRRMVTEVVTACDIPVRG